MSCTQLESHHDMYISSGKIFSKWFLESLGLEGLVKMLEVYEDKSAEAFCTIAYTTGPGSEPIMFYGSVKVR